MPLTRFFNRVELTDHTVRKTSTDREKLIREYRYFHLLPRELRKSFVEPFDLEDDGVEATYSMDRVWAPDLAVEWTSGLLRGDRFQVFLASVSDFLTSRPRRQVGSLASKSVAQEAYVAKTRRRVSSLLSTEAGQVVDARLRALGIRGGLVATLSLFEREYSEIGVHEGVSKGFLSLSHGDLCLSNCFLSCEEATPTIRLIDPRGASTRDELFDDYLYDYAKLSHSILGNYDFIVRGSYDLCHRVDGIPEVVIRPGPYASLSSEQRKFTAMCQDHGVDMKSLRVCEAALFLSMLPLHAEDSERVIALAVNANSLLYS